MPLRINRESRGGIHRCEIYISRPETCRGRTKCCENTFFRSHTAILAIPPFFEKPLDCLYSQHDTETLSSPQLASTAV